MAFFRIIQGQFHHGEDQHVSHESIHQMLIGLHFYRTAAWSFEGWLRFDRCCVG